MNDLKRSFSSASAFFSFWTKSPAARAIWSKITKMNIKNPDRNVDPDWTVIRQMTGYIQNHYHEKIRLEDIAAAGAVCRSKCCQLFSRKLL